METNVYDILRKVYGARGLPFPNPPKDNSPSKVGKAGEYPTDNSNVLNGFTGSPSIVEYTKSDMGSFGSPIRKYEDEVLGKYIFLPATINNIDLPNAIVIIRGTKEIKQTDIVDVGTVFEQVFRKPYDISIIVTLMGENKDYPENELKQIKALWDIDDVVTLRCASTDIFLQKENNFLITNIALLDNQGIENAEVVQIDGLSNIDFELEIIN